jgi:hypothetical protein
MTVHVRPWPGGASPVLKFKIEKALAKGVKPDPDVLAAYLERPHDLAQIRYFLAIMFPEEVEDPGMVRRDYATFEELVREGREIVADHGWDKLEEWYRYHYNTVCACMGAGKPWHPICRCAMSSAIHENLDAILMRLAEEANLD